MTKKRHKSAPKAARAVAESPQDGPTREWRRHHDAERVAETQGWRHRTRVQQLYVEGRIGRDEVDAARRYLDDYEIGVAGAHVGPGGGGGGLLADGRLDALTRWRKANEAVGYDTALLVALVVEDATWATLASKIGAGLGGWGDERAKRASARVLTLLAEHYARPRRQSSALASTAARVASVEPRSTTRTGTSSCAATIPSIAR